MGEVICTNHPKVMGWALERLGTSAYFSGVRIECLSKHNGKKRQVMRLSSPFFFLLLTAAFWVSSSSALGSFYGPFLAGTETQTWSNNGSVAVAETIVYDDGSVARLILMTEGNDSIPLPPFGCGFISSVPAGAGNHSTTYFFGVLILGGLNTSVANRQVWLANRDKAIGESETLEFTAEGGLALRDSDGTSVWSSRTSGKSLVGIELDGKGNLQLYNTNETVFWQSFDEPTDALLPGQWLYSDAQLAAGASANNWSSGGQYYVQMSSHGFSAYVRADAALKTKYLNLGPVRTVGPPPTTYAVHDGQNFVLTIGGAKYSYGISPKSAAADASYRYLRLGFDGHLRTYRWQKTNSWEEIYDLVSEKMDYCQHPNVCGDYGICNRGGKCSCPKAIINGSSYFKQIEGASTGLGCTQNVALSCQSPLDRHRLVNLGNLSYFSFIDSQAADLKFRSLDACKNTDIVKVSKIQMLKRHLVKVGCFLLDMLAAWAFDRRLRERRQAHEVYCWIPVHPGQSKLTMNCYQAVAGVCLFASCSYHFGRLQL